MMIVLFGNRNELRLLGLAENLFFRVHENLRVARVVGGALVKIVAQFGADESRGALHNVGMAPFPHHHVFLYFFHRQSVEWWPAQRAHGLARMAQAERAQPCAQRAVTLFYGRQ